MATLSQIHSKDGEIQSRQAEINALRHEAATQNAEANRLSGEIAGAVQRLAQLYVPGFTQSAVGNVPEEFRKAVTTLYEQKQDRIAQLDELLEVSSRHVTELQRREIEAASALAQGRDRRERIEAQYQDTLTNNEEYQAARTSRAGLRLDAENTAKELERRQARKTEFQAPYLADPFFQYFLKRDVESPCKEPTLTQRVDRLLAKSVYDFSTRKRKFDLFEAETWEAEQEVSELADALKEADVPVRDIEARIATELGLVTAREQVTSMTAHHKEAISALEQATQDQNRYRQERVSLDTERGVYYQKAVDTVVSQLTGRGLEDLVALARATPSPEDDGIVERISGWREGLDGVQNVLLGLREQEQTVASVLAGLQSERARLKRAYDDEQEEIERRRREEQRRRDEERRRREREEEEDRRRRNSYSSSDSSSSFGGGFGGGGSSFGGGFGGGGSSVGGSF